MTKLLNDICDLFQETVGRYPRTETEALDWAFEQGLIADYECGAFAIAGY